MLAGKNHLIRLGIACTIIASFAVMAAFAGRDTVSASAPRGSKVVAHLVTRRPLGPNTTPRPTPIVGPNVNTAGCDADATTAGCNQDASVALPLAGTLSAQVGDAAVSGGTSIDLVPAGQSIGFTLPTTMIDTRGGTAVWSLSAASAGIPLNPAGAGTAGSLTGAITLTGVTGVCTSTATPASCTLGTNSIINTLPTSGTLTGTAIPFAAAPTASDFGSTIVTATGTIAIPANVLGGSYSGTITVTATPI